MKRYTVARLSLMFSLALLVIPMSANAQKDEPRFKIGGYTQLDYYRGDNGTSNVAEQQATMRRVRMNFGAGVTDQVSFNIVPQFDDSGTGARTGTLKDAFATIKLHDLASLRAGTFKYEFDLEGRESSAVRPLMNRAVATNVVAGSMHGGSGDFRDTGVSLFGRTSLGGDASMGYGLGLWQGVGPNARDVNSKIGTTANLWVSPLKGLRVNTGYMAADTTPEGDVENDKYSAWVIGAQYDQGPIMARFEYYDATREDGPVDIDRKGWYVAGAYSVLPNVDLMARYQVFEDDSWGSNDNELSSIDLGAKYYFAKKGRRAGTNVSVNYMIRDADAGVTRNIFDERGGAVTGDDINNILMARLQMQL